MDLELEIRVTFNLEDIAKETRLSKTGFLLHVVAFSSLTRLNQSWLFDLEEGTLWADLVLDSSRMGGAVDLRFELLAGFESERYSDLSAEPMCKLAEAEYQIAVEDGNSRLRVDVFEFDGSINYPTDALWRVEVDFPRDLSAAPDLELNNVLWVTLNEKYLDFANSQQGRQLLKYEMQCRIISEALSIEGLSEHCLRAANAVSCSTFESAVGSVFHRYFEPVTSNNHNDLVDYWRSNQTEIRTLIQAGSWK